MTTGELIREARKKAGLTQNELGARMGISGVMVSQYEAGKRNPKPLTMRRIAAALGVNVYDIVPDVFSDEYSFDYGHMEALESVREFIIQPFGYTLSDAEKKLVRPFSMLDDEGQAEIIGAVLAMLEEGKHTRT